jgi:hypothetical protein
VRGLGEVARGAVGVDEAGQEVEVAGPFVFRALLRFYVEMNAVKGIFGVVFIELHDIVNVIEELFAGLARLVGVGARQEGFDVNIRFVQLADEVGELILF